MYIIQHDEMGIYLGHCLGLGFWSDLDPVGQTAAVTFATREEAKDHIKTWNTHNDPDDYQYPLVQSEDPYYITREELAEQGLPTWNV